MRRVLALLLLAACAAPPGASRAPGPAAPGPNVAPEARSFLAVVDAVEPVAEAACRSRDPGRSCDFRIVVDDRPGMPPNAFQTLDRQGRPLIAVTVALLRAVRTPDELAFVLAHEASHHVAGHLGRQAAVAREGAAVFARIAGGEAGATPASIREAGEIGALLGARSYSKEFELEADAMGARIAAQAGYDPVGGAQFFLRLPDPGNRFLGTHPSNAERIAAVAQAVAGF